MVFQEIALYKVATEKLLEKGSMEDLIRRYHIRILEMNSDFVVLQKAGHYDETQRLFDELRKQLVYCNLSVRVEWLSLSQKWND